MPGPAGAALALAAVPAMFAGAAGCRALPAGRTAGERAAAAAARPILELDPDAVWTDCYNRLVALGPAAIDYLATHPRLERPSAPDDLRLLVHTSLLRRLANPATAPRLSASCLDTSCDLLHFDVRVGGRPLGGIAMVAHIPPRAWHELFPAEFDHDLAARIDVEADRRALCAWYAAHRGDPAALAGGRPLRPRSGDLWRLLARGYADAWTYQPEPTAVLCEDGPPRAPVLLQVRTYEYNLVRAACVWLGAAGGPEVRERLIELVGSPVPTVAYNARFALRYAPDARIRALLEAHPLPGAVGAAPAK